MPAALQVSQLRRKAILLVGMGCVHENHADDITAAHAGVHTNVVSPHRVANDDIRRRNTCGLQERVKLFGNCFARSRLGTRVAEAKTSTVVGTDPRKLSDLGLYLVP